jgi:two-component system cell cycle sensor histidine kinase/response regulator CckA
VGDRRPPTIPKMKRFLVFGAAPLVGLDFLGERYAPWGITRYADLIAFGMLLALIVYSEAVNRRAHATQAKIVRDERRLAFAQAAAHIGSWDVDATGGEVWSQSFRRLMGLPSDAPASTEAFHMAVHPDDRAAVVAKDRRMFTEGGEHEFEYRIVRPDGEVRWMLTRGRCELDEQGSGTRVLGVAIDITERKADEESRLKLEQQLTQAQKLETIGRLAGGIAHDFNNVLTGISGYAELARSSLDEGRPPGDALDEISAGAARAAALTRQLLAFSRKQVMNEETLDLNEIVLGAERLLQRVIGEDAQLEHVLGTDPVLVTADRTQLEQVIMNLVVNARDSMPKGGHIVVEVDEVDVDAGHSLDLRPGRFALLAVTDSGQGMDAETAACIFEPFFTTKAGGTGLGLATVHGIVTQTGGTIWVYSEPGAGTTFKIYLPLSEAAAMPAPAPRPDATSPAGVGSEHILVVEDDRQVRAIVKQMLMSRGFAVTTAADAEEALACADGPAQFDLILSDLVLPEMSGRELVEAIGSRQPQAAVMFMSGYSDDAVRRRGVLEPGSAFIEKPFSLDELVQRVRSLLDATAVAA